MNAGFLLVRVYSVIQSKCFFPKSFNFLKNYKFLTFFLSNHKTEKSRPDDRAPSDLQLALRQWRAGNVYLLVLSKAAMGLQITWGRKGLSISRTFSLCNTSYHFRMRKKKSARYENQGYKWCTATIIEVELKKKKCHYRK